MSSDFWFPLYPEKWDDDTLHLTAEQDGIYFRLIRHYMKTREPLPDNDIALARIAGVNEINWLNAKRIVIAYFTHANGMFFHEFCDQILDIQDKRSKMRSKSAEKAAKKRWEKNKQNQMDIFGSHAERNASPMRGDAISTSTKIKKDKKTKAKKDFMPEDISKTVWEDFKSHRKAKKAPVTETAVNRIRTEAEKIGWTLEQALIETCAQGWQGFKAEWISNNQNPKGKNTNDRIAKIAQQSLLDYERSIGEASANPDAGSPELPYFQPLREG